MDETIERVDEELEKASNPNYKITVKTALKYITGFAATWVVSSVMAIATVGSIYYVAGKAFNSRSLLISVKYGLPRVAKIYAIATPIYSVLMTGVFLAEYKKNLQMWKGNLEVVRRDLQEKLRKAQTEVM